MCPKSGGQGSGIHVAEVGALILRERRDLSIGLTLLFPYLLSRKKRWARCKVRIFVGGDVQQVEEQRKE